MRVESRVFTQTLLSFPRTTTFSSPLTTAAEGGEGEGTAPLALALTPDGSKLYVVNFSSHNVSVITTATLQVTAIPVGLNPKAIVITPNGQRAYVANSAPGEDSVSAIDTTTDTVLDTLPVSRPDPSVLALSPEGTVLYVLGEKSRFVGVVDTATNQLGRLEAGQDPVAIAFSPDGIRAYIVNNGANTVSIFNTTAFPPTKIDDVEVGEAPRSAVVSPDGAKVYVTNFLDNTLSVLHTTQKPVQVQVISFDQWQGPWNILLDPKSIGTSEPKALVINRTSNDQTLLLLPRPKGTKALWVRISQRAYPWITFLSSFPLTATSNGSLSSHHHGCTAP